MSGLLAGASMGKITPSEELLAKIRSEDPSIKYTGIYTDLYVRAIALADGETRIVMLSVDMSAFPSQQLMSDELIERFSLSPNGVLFGSTRNHQSITITCKEEAKPAVEGEKILSPSEEAYIRQIHATTIEVVQRAFDAACPARIAFKTVHSRMNTKRDWETPLGTKLTQDYNGKSDDTMVLMRVADLKDNTIALWINYAMAGRAYPIHRKQFSMVSADITGDICRFIERYSGERFPVLWTVGGTGDQEGLFLSELDYLEVKGEGELSVVHEEIPHEVALTICKKLSSLEAMEIMSMTADMGTYQDSLSFYFDKTYRSLPARTEYRALKQSPMPGERPEPVPHPLHPTLDLKLRLAVINDTALVGVNGESTKGIADRIRAALPGIRVAVTDMNYGFISCIPDRDAERENGQAAIASFLWDAAKTEAAVDDAMKELAERYRGKNSR